MRKKILMSSVAACLLAGAPAMVAAEDAAESAVDQGSPVTVEPIPEVMEIPADEGDPAIAGEERKSIDEAPPAAPDESAADEPPAYDETGPTAEEQIPAMPESENAPTAEEQSPVMPETETVEGDWAPEDLIGSPVYDLDENEVGTIREVVVDTADGTKLVVEYGGFLGFLTKEVEVPIDLFQTEADGRVMVSLTEDELDAMYANARQEAAPDRDS